MFGFYLRQAHLTIIRPETFTDSRKTAINEEIKSMNANRKPYLLAKQRISSYLAG